MCTGVHLCVARDVRVSDLSLNPGFVPGWKPAHSSDAPVSASSGIWVTEVWGSWLWILHKCCGYKR